MKPGAGIFRSASGSILAVPQGYTQHIQTLRFLRGSLRPGQVVLDQQLAATLQAGIGDRVSLTARPGTPPQSYRVSGVALVTSPDVLFQPLNPQLGAAPAPATACPKPSPGSQEARPTRRPLVAAAPASELTSRPS